MNPSIIFVAGLAITLVSAFLVVLYLHSRLDPILVDLCGTLERARFWTSFSNVTLTLVPMIRALGYRPGLRRPQRNSLWKQTTRRKPWQSFRVYCLRWIRTARVNPTACFRAREEYRRKQPRIPPAQARLAEPEPTRKKSFSRRLAFSAAFTIIPITRI
jgi:hypothetical protein